MSDRPGTANYQKWLLMLSGAGGEDGSALRAGADLALAAGAFGQSVTLVFAGDAIKLLHSSIEGDDTLWRLLGSLPYYDIDSVHALDLDETIHAWREDLPIVPMSPSEWRSAALKADIVVHY